MHDPIKFEKKELHGDNRCELSDEKDVLILASFFNGALSSRKNKIQPDFFHFCCYQVSESLFLLNQKYFMQMKLMVALFELSF